MLLSMDTQYHPTLGTKLKSEKWEFPFKVEDFSSGNLSITLLGLIE